MYSKIVVSIGGSDSGGGAGIQADLRTFMALKVHGCSVITCVTAQNSRGVDDLIGIRENLICGQIESVFKDFNISAIKTGMLLNKPIIEATAEILRKYDAPKIIDPVMVARSGSRLLEDDAVQVYLDLLFPQADIVTPNIFEAELLTDLEIKSPKDVEHAGEIILNKGVKSALIKGGGLKSLRGKDFFISNDGGKEWMEHEHIKTSNTHGSGCTLSAAISGYSALGFGLVDAIRKAKTFTEGSLRNSYKIGSGPGPLGHHEKFS